MLATNLVTPSDNDAPLLEQNGIQYFMLKTKHIEETCPIMVQSFAEEQIMTMTGINTPEFLNLFFETYLKVWAPAVVDNGLSVVAVDKETGKICGAFMAMDNYLGEIPMGVWWKTFTRSFALMKAGPRYGEMEEIIAKCNKQLHTELNDIVKKYKLKSEANIICEMMCVGVHKDF
mgnify:CR=1 FL=1|tara:strand:+ start:202 stop:726 length:525 start_codon:yes stop_codon:yes gene_type:complete